MGHPSAGEELAGFLRELKGRSGRSYDALARRLGVSSSALHRYCSGEGLPPRYSVLEQFVIECGASRAEIVKLHRLWADVAAAERTSQGDTAATSARSAALGARPITDAIRVPDGGRLQRDEEILDGDSTRSEAGARRRRPSFFAQWPVLAIVPAALLVVAAAVTYTTDVRRDDTNIQAESSTASLSAPQPCVERTGVSHDDEQLGSRVWSVDYVCTNRDEAPLYLTPSSWQRIGVMDTTRSWFVCWLPGRVQGDGGRIWYYTRGDRSEPGTEQWAGWGFMSSEHVSTSRHPWPEMPKCDFSAQALSARETAAPTP